VARYQKCRLVNQAFKFLARSFEFLARSSNFDLSQKKPMFFFFEKIEKKGSVLFGSGGSCRGSEARSYAARVDAMRELVRIDIRTGRSVSKCFRQMCI
jgi:hypothetical protein